MVITLHKSRATFNNSNVKVFTSNIPQHLGGTDYGNVFKNGPYGNPNASQKIAFVVGVHPLEINSHSAMVQTILKLNESSTYSYYIYSINVTQDRELYNEERMNG